MITNQQVFNKAYAHASQMKNLSQDNGHCKYRSTYRSTNGESCLIGGFIPDERYEPAMEGLCVNALAITYPELMIDINLLERGNNYSKPNVERVFFLSDLQLRHDFALSLEDMFHKLEDFRIKYNLNKPE